jgi:hypothetical protein
MTTDPDSVQRGRVLEAYESVRSLDAHGELVRLILTEASMLAEKYRCVRRHDVPHVRELAGLLDLLWQEVEMVQALPVTDQPDQTAFPQL